MSLRLSYLNRNLRFKFKAITSRGTLQEHTAFYFLLHSPTDSSVVGVGESAPLAGLSVEHGPGFEQQVEEVCRAFNQLNLTPGAHFVTEACSLLHLQGLPSVRFALETAIADFLNGGKRMIFRNAFATAGQGIPINGLIWMGAPAFMRDQIRKKREEGYTCLKLKIGGLDFATECAILREIRQVATPADLTIRLDANGAFSPQEALPRLEALAKFGVHSIEQPIRQGQEEEMARICAQSPIPVALDEELIGQNTKEQKEQLLSFVRPAYVILKPTLVGGFAACGEWIGLAEQAGIGWWLTSALESNIGLNAISQFAAEHQNPLPQGLGTGQLYHNNIVSPLYIRSGCLYYAKQQPWENFYAV